MSAADTLSDRSTLTQTAVYLAKHAPGGKRNFAVDRLALLAAALPIGHRCMPRDGGPRPVPEGDAAFLREVATVILHQTTAADRVHIAESLCRIASTLPPDRRLV